MVSMCASCNDIYPWAALVIGFVAGVAYLVWHRLILMMQIDDPIDAVAGDFVEPIAHTPCDEEELFQNVYHLFI